MLTDFFWIVFQQNSLGRYFCGSPLSCSIVTVVPALESGYGRLPSAWVLCTARSSPPFRGLGFTWNTTCAAGKPPRDLSLSAVLKTLVWSELASRSWRIAAQGPDPSPFFLPLKGLSGSGCGKATEVGGASAVLS